MKYLKKFNESNSNKVEDVKKFCNENLAYLIDAGFYLMYSTSSSFIDKQKGILPKQCSISLHKHSGFMKWDEIVDDFVPFLQILNNKYELVKLEPTSKRDKYSKKCSFIFNDYNYLYRYSLDDLINDRTSGISHKDLDYITFSIKI